MFKESLASEVSKLNMTDEASMKIKRTEMNAIFTIRMD